MFVPWGLPSAEAVLWWARQTRLCCVLAPGSQPLASPRWWHFRAVARAKPSDGPVACTTQLFSALLICPRAQADKLQLGTELLPKDHLGKAAPFCGSEPPGWAGAETGHLGHLSA